MAVLAILLTPAAPTPALAVPTVHVDTPTLRIAHVDPPTIRSEADTPTLRSLAESRGRFIGAAANYGYLTGRPERRRCGVRELQRLCRCAPNCAATLVAFGGIMASAILSAATKHVVYGVTAT